MREDVVLAISSAIFFSSAEEIAEAASADVHPNAQTVSGNLAGRLIWALTYGILQTLSGELATRDQCAPLGTEPLATWRAFLPTEPGRC